MKSFNLQLCKKHDNLTCLINLKSTYPESISTNKKTGGWCSESLNYWSQNIITNVLLLYLVYLTHCEGAVLLNWWWENDEKDHLGFENQALCSEICITTTFTMNQKKACENVIARSDLEESTIKDIESATQHLTSEIEPYSIGYLQMEKKENLLIRKDDTAQDTFDKEIKHDAITFQHREILGGVTISKHLQINERPIIGVLSQEQSPYLRSKYSKENFRSYIAASYVKLVEASGARVVPILIGKDLSYYREIVRKINGVVFPGGATFFNQPDGFADAGQYIYDAALEINQNGGYFPIFGICLGFELLIILASGRGEKENRISCCSFSNCSLNFVEGFRNSKMFRNSPDRILDILSKEDVTVNAHQFCITNDNINNFNLTYDWLVTSYSVDDNEVDFVATIENKRYPFYGVQFHPEKPSFEWKSSKNYPHTEHAVQANRYFMDFFIEEAKKNNHQFDDIAEENKYLIYNYEPYFTGLVGSAYHQCYFFEPKFEPYLF